MTSIGADRDQILKDYNSSKYKKLAASLLIDLIGLASYFIPMAGEILDMPWSIVAGVSCFLLYGGIAGIIGGGVVTIEEMLPFTDIIPTLTIVWVYKHIINNEETLINYIERKKSLLTHLRYNAS